MSTYRAIQAIGESFFRCYNEASRVVMTANVGASDATGYAAVSVIWQDPEEVFGSSGHKAAINAIRAAASSPDLRSGLGL